MDTEIKYENCEAIWDQTEQQPSWNTGNTVPAATTMRNTIIGNRNFNEYRNCGAESERVGMEEIGSYDYDNFSRNSVNSMGSGNGNNYNRRQQYQHGYESKGRFVAISGKLPPKGDQRRRTEYSAVFSPPFFKLQEDHASLKPRAVISARCLSCNVLLRGNKYVSSNFLKHLKRLHPHMYKMYDKVKLLKNRGLSTSTAAATANDDDDHNDHAYFDASTFLSTNPNENAMDETAEEEEERNLENTDNSETSFSCNEVSEIIETSNAQSNKEASAAQVRVVSDESLRAITTVEDSVTNKLHLSSETIQAIAQLLDEKLKGFVTKTDLNNAINTVKKQQPQEKTPAIQSDSSTSALQAQINSLNKKYTELRNDVMQSNLSKRQLQRELQAMDGLIRRRYLIIRNLQIENNEKVHKAVEELFSGRLQLPHIHVKRVVVLTKLTLVQNKQNVLVELQNERHASEIFRNCSKLRNTGIYIESELSQFARKRKEKLLVLRKEILRRNADLKVIVRQTFMMIQKKRFYWDDVEGLYIDSKDNGSTNESMNALESLQKLTGLDLKEFLHVLKTYDIKMNN